MANIKFNTAQLNNPTPRGVARVFKMIIAINAAVTIWLGTASYIPNNISNIFGSILSLVTLLCVALEPFFGVETAKTSVPIADVTEMKSNE